MKISTMRVLYALFLSIFLYSCADTSTSPGPGMGTMRVSLTDAPSCGYDHVFITVDHIEISVDGSSWTTIPVSTNVVQPIDLLDLANGIFMTLGEAPLSAGTYEQVRLVLAANTGNGPTLANAVVLSGQTTQIPLTTPSAQQSGYKILGPITVSAGVLTDLVLDFNACKSIVVAGNSGHYLLKPVVTATAQVVSGTISGFALAGSNVSAYLEPDGTFLTGTVVPSTGATAQFNLGPLIQTSTSTSIDVVIVPPDSAAQGTIVVQDVPVTADVTTWISPSDGTSAFNSSNGTASTINTVSGTITIGSTPGSANVVASQTITSSDRTYEIASTVSSSTTGLYSLPLAESGPWVGTYSATLPISLTEDTAASDAGIYSGVVASDSLATSTETPVNVSTCSASAVDFTLSQ